MTTAIIRSALLCSQPSTNEVLGADVSGRLTAVTVAGDGVILYDSTQSLEGSYILGGTGRLAFTAPAALNSTHQTCSAVVADSSAGGSHRLVSWPTSSRKQRSTKPGGGFTTIAQVPQTVPLPCKGCSVHILYPPAHADQQQHPFTAVVLQDGTVGICGQDAIKLNAVTPALSTPQEQIPTVRASSSTHASLFTLHQSSAGSQALIHEYIAYKKTFLRHVRRHNVPVPSQSALALSLHASSSYVVITWSTGAVTLIKGVGCSSPSSNTPLSTPGSLHLTLPPHMHAPSSAPAKPAPSPGSKRKAEPAGNGHASATLLAAAPVDDTQVLVVRVHQESSGAPAMQYALLDQQYGCTVSTGSISLEGMPQLAASLAAAGGQPGPNWLRLYSHSASPTQLVLQVGATLVALTVETRPANLLALVGKLSVSAPAGTQPAAGGVPASACPTTLNMGALTHILYAPESAGPGITLQDVPQVEPHSGSALVREAVDQGTARLVAELQRAAQSDRPADPAVVNQAADLLIAELPRLQLQAGGAWALQTQLAPLVAAALAQAGGWDRLMALLRVLPQQSLAGCGQLLPAACRAGQFVLLPELCIKLDEVPAEVLVETLRELLAVKRLGEGAGFYTELRAAAEHEVLNAEEEVRCCVGDLDTAVERRREALARAQCAAAAVDGFSQTQTLLHTPLSLHMDPASLAGALRALSNRQVDQLLKYLTTWVTKYTKDMGLCAAMGLMRDPLPVTLLFPTFTQVLEWVRLLIDAHLPRLLMAPQPLPSLATLLDLTHRQVKACQHLIPLVGAVEHIRSAAPLPAANLSASSQYTVQYVDLGIRA